MWCLYQPAWEHLPEMRNWLTQSPTDRGRAFCKLCNIEITACISSLREHATKHRHDGPVDVQPTPQVAAEEAEHEASSSLHEDAPERPKQRKVRRLRTGQTGYRAAWRTIPELSAWLCASPRRKQWAFCKACNKEMVPLKNQLLHHATTKAHIRRMNKLSGTTSSKEDGKPGKKGADRAGLTDAPVRRSKRLSSRTVFVQGRKRRDELTAATAGTDSEVEIVLAPIDNQDEFREISQPSLRLDPLASDGDAGSENAQSSGVEISCNVLGATVTKDELFSAPPEPWLGGGITVKEEEEEGECSWYLIGPSNDSFDDEWHRGRGTKGFKEAWRKDPRFSGWLRRSARDPRRAFCLYCYREIAGKLKVIERHATQPVHLRRESWVHCAAPVGLADGPNATEGEQEMTGRELQGTRILEYDPKWEQEPEVRPWLRRSPNNPLLAFCIICSRNLTPKLAHLRRHGAAARHRRKAAGEPAAMKKPKRLFQRHNSLRLPQRSVWRQQRPPAREQQDSRVQRVDTNFGEIRIVYGPVNDQTGVGPIQVLNQGNAGQSAPDAEVMGLAAPPVTGGDGGVQCQETDHQGNGGGAPAWDALETIESLETIETSATETQAVQQPGTVIPLVPSEPAADILEACLNALETDGSAVKQNSDDPGNRQTSDDIGNTQTSDKSAVKQISDESAADHASGSADATKGTRPKATSPSEKKERRRAKFEPRKWMSPTGKVSYDYTTYRPSWEQLAGLSWLQPVADDPRQAFCTWCRRTMVAKLAHLLRHSRTGRHKSRSKLAAGVDSSSEEGLGGVEKPTESGDKKVRASNVPPMVEGVKLETSASEYEEGSEHVTGDAEPVLEEEEAPVVTNTATVVEGDPDGTATEATDLKSQDKAEPIRGMVASVIDPSAFVQVESTSSKSPPPPSSPLPPPPPPDPVLKALRQSTRVRRPTKPLCVLDSEDSYLKALRLREKKPFRKWKKIPEISSWVRLSPWGTGQPFCRVCRHDLTPKTTHLLRHAVTKMHQKKMQADSVADVAKSTDEKKPAPEELAKTPVPDPVCALRYASTVESGDQSVEPEPAEHPEGRAGDGPRGAADTVEVALREQPPAVPELCRVCKHPLVAGVNIFSTRTAFSRTLVASKLSRLVQAPVTQDMTDAEVCSSCVRLLNELDQSEMRVIALENEVKLKFKMPCPLAVQGQVPPLQMEKEDVMVQEAPAAEQAVSVVASADASDSAPSRAVPADTLPTDGVAAVEATVVEEQVIPESAEHHQLRPAESYYTIGEDGELKPVTALYDSDGNMVNIMYQVQEHEVQLMDSGQAAIFWEAETDTFHEQQQQQEQQLSQQDQYPSQPPSSPPPSRRRKKWCGADGDNKGEQPTSDGTWRADTWDVDMLSVPAPPDWVPPQARPRGRPPKNAPTVQPTLQFGQCPRCGVTFPNATKLRQHMVQNHPECLHQCELCERLFMHRSSLREHMLRHKGATFECPDCGRSFGANSDLQKHRVFVHTTERAFACELCSYAGKFKWMLQRHQRKVHMAML